MQRDVAIRVDGMLLGAMGNLGEIVSHLKNNLDAEEFQKYVTHLSEALGDLFDLSQNLHKLYPDIVPKELMPPSDD